jgi:hypothetical protein
MLKGYVWERRGVLYWKIPRGRSQGRLHRRDVNSHVAISPSLTHISARVPTFTCKPMNSTKTEDGDVFVPRTRRCDHPLRVQWQFDFVRQEHLPETRKQHSHSPQNNYSDGSASQNPSPTLVSPSTVYPVTVTTAVKRARSLG